MQRQRGSLVPVAEVVSGLNGPVKAIRDASPQARHHFTRFDQVNQLVSAREADPDLGFMARMLALCSLPRTNPGNQHQYKRVNGPYKLILSRTGEYRLPFGNLPRLLLAWVTTEAVRTQSRVLVLGDSLAEFMRALGVYSNSGRVHTRLHNQINRLFNSHVRLVYKDERGESSMSSSVADRTEFWWNERKPDQPVHGSLARLLMAYVSTEAVRTQSRDIVLGRSLSDFMRKLDLHPDGGSERGDRTRLRNQMERLFGCSVSLIYEDERGKRFVRSHIAESGMYWWNPKRPDERMLWDSKIRPCPGEPSIIHENQVNQACVLFTNMVTCGDS